MPFFNTNLCAYSLTTPYVWVVLKQLFGSMQECWYNANLCSYSFRTSF